MRAASAALEKKGLIKITEEQVLRDPYKTLEERGAAHTLTEDQQRAVDSVRSDSRTVQLLHGVTGSGKTEIYLSLIADCLKQGKTAVFLVPEISLTPQMLAQLRSRFGKNAAIMHSGLSAGEKFDEWWRLRSGEAKIAVGARSACSRRLKISASSSSTKNTIQVTRAKPRRVTTRSISQIFARSTTAASWFSAAPRRRWKRINAPKRANLI